jgi:hypothetical protein
VISAKQISSQQIGSSPLSAIASLRASTIPPQTDELKNPKICYGFSEPANWWPETDWQIFITIEAGTAMRKETRSRNVRSLAKISLNKGPRMGISKPPVKISTMAIFAQPLEKV